jgi:hypothetical protein
MTLLLSPLLIKNIIDFKKKKEEKDNIINSCWFCQQKCYNFVSICETCKYNKIKKK